MTWESSRCYRTTTKINRSETLPAVSQIGLLTSYVVSYSCLKTCQRKAQTAQPVEILKVISSAISPPPILIMTIKIVQMVDAVTGACMQICAHLSEPLFDLVLKRVYDYASTTVRSNAVRAIHQLVECVANANPAKTLAMFFPLCVQNIRVEIENGASSLRTTATFSPLPSDATLHWSELFRCHIPTVWLMTSSIRFGHFTRRRI